MRLDRPLMSGQCRLEDRCETELVGRESTIDTEGGRNGYFVGGMFGVVVVAFYCIAAQFTYVSCTP